MALKSFLHFPALRKNWLQLAIASMKVLGKDVIYCKQGQGRGKRRGGRKKRKKVSGRSTLKTCVSSQRRFYMDVRAALFRESGVAFQRSVCS